MFDPRKFFAAIVWAVGGMLIAQPTQNEAEPNQQVESGVVTQAEIDAFVAKYLPLAEIRCAVKEEDKPAWARVEPEVLFDKLSDDDRAYAEKLQAVVNENFAFLADVPFFVPDIAALRRGNTAASLFRKNI